MRVVDVVYDDYALVHTIKTKDGVSEVLNQLYSKYCHQGGILRWIIYELGSVKANLTVLQVVLLKSVKCCSRSSHSSLKRLVFSLTTLWSCLQAVKQTIMHLCCIYSMTFANSPSICDHSWVSWGLKSLLHHSSSEAFISAGSHFCYICCKVKLFPHPRCQPKTKLQF